MCFCSLRCTTAAYNMVTTALSGKSGAARHWRLLLWLGAVSPTSQVRPTRHVIMWHAEWIVCGAAPQHLHLKSWRMWCSRPPSVVKSAVHAHLSLDLPRRPSPVILSVRTRSTAVHSGQSAACGCHDNPRRGSGKRHYGRPLVAKAGPVAGWRGWAGLCGGRCMVPGAGRCAGECSAADPVGAGTDVAGGQGQHVRAYPNPNTCASGYT